jgi:cytochrome c oxidase subunit III
MGMYLFILSEVMLFASFFASIFYSYYEVSYLVGCEIPFYLICLINPFKLPLLNTLLLLASSIILTYGHIELTANHGTTQYGNRRYVISTVMVAIFFGILFLVCQY